LQHNSRIDRRKRIAHEAAELLYTGQEKEYKQSKLHAAQILGFNILPSNAEIAGELDRIAEEREGETRSQRLVQMRAEALKLMRILGGFNPLLVGSVWRGTIHRNSDIDIRASAQDPQEVISRLTRAGYKNLKTKTESVVKKGKRQRSIHVQFELPSTNKAEIVLRDPHDAKANMLCEIYGDIITGLTTQRLHNLLKENPKEKFVPASTS
jgi:predicted nucleotidyltransferase